MGQTKEIRKIHFVGIKGVGMTPLAIIAKEAGFKVTGSDIHEDFITKDSLERAKIEIFPEFASKNIEGRDMVIVSAAHGGFENIEAVSAKSQNIPVISQAEALGLFQTGKIFGKEFEGIAVSGSHGKTTTTAMIATILKECSMDPSYSVGTGDIPTLGSPGHLGKGKFFVCEADEYISFNSPKFLFLKPKIAVITNIDFDHPDVYSDLSQIEDAFLKFTKNLEEDGILIACGDGEENANFLKKVVGRKITYGFSKTNDYYIEKVNFSGGKTFFWVNHRDNSLGEFSIDIFGDQNALDGLAAIIAAMEAGLPLDKIKKGLSVYKGSKRRSEFVGTTKYGAKLFDDYAHHPSEIQKTLDAFRKNFPKERIIPIFQPHMYSRTKLLLDDFVRSFDKCDFLIISEIFPSFREERDESFSAEILADKISKRRGKTIFIKNLGDVVKYLDNPKFGQDHVLITMGAGDIYKINKELIL